jgi:alkaline phosphatase
MPYQSEFDQLGRRAFLKRGTLILAAACVADPLKLLAETQSAVDVLRVGMVTDIHHAEKDSAGTRFYRESLNKLTEASLEFEKAKPTFIVELGDIIDRADSVDRELRYLTTINKEFSAIHKDRFYVLGNHCVDTLNKDEFLGVVEQKKSYDSFDRDGFHFVYLDSCFRSDGQSYGRKNSKSFDANIPTEELEWLAADLKSTPHKTIVFVHQRLDVNDGPGVRNSPAVRNILEASGKVVAVFQGHSHQNALAEIAGIHYCTLRAMIEGSGAENNGYTVMDITRDGTIQLSGFRKQANYKWNRPA